MANEEGNVNLYNVLRNLGVCEICAYRYVENSVCSLITKLLAEKENLQLEPSNGCILCLGLLHRSVMKTFAIKIADMMFEMNFDCTTYMLAISVPSCLYIREHSLTLYLKSEGSFTSENLAKLPYLHFKETWRNCVSLELKSLSEKNFCANSPLIFTVNMHYADNIKECCLLGPLMKTRKRSHHSFPLNDINNALELIPDKPSLMRYFSCPPTAPTLLLTCDSVSVFRESVFCAGRYNKWSRTLPQTPWILDGERKLENSVSEIITSKLEPAFKAESSKFSSSGREDVDARMLGIGRPFAIELLNPRLSNLSANELRCVENSINENGFDQIFVRDLQIISRDLLKCLKEGEEEKLKEYCALCVAYGKVTEAMLKTCCSSAPFVIHQKTPIRVLHRRPAAVRPRTIHNLEATILKEDPSSDACDWWDRKRLGLNSIIENIKWKCDTSVTVVSQNIRKYQITLHFDKRYTHGTTLIKLHITTQAGTYVKEFIHGDFGRTVPCFSDLIGGIPADILALDVTLIKIDWPPAVNDQEV